MNRVRDKDLDYFDLEDDSDQERAESSDDDLDILLHGTPEQQRKLCRRSTGQTDQSSSEDEFEKEMNAELNGKVKALEKRRGSLTEPGCSTSVADQLEEEDRSKQNMDDVYCDSDEEEMVTKGDALSKRKQLSNDDLLYDPDIDSDNEKWAEEQRRSYLPKTSQKSNKVKPLPNSDAVLNCPACMTQLCLDCQRHDVYNNQYRAMFVMNCTVDRTERLTYPKSGKNAQKRKKQKSSVPQDLSDKDKFHPVKCEECNTVVAVFDEDEVYHFFNVLASY